MSTSAAVCRPINLRLGREREPTGPRLEKRFWSCGWRRLRRFLPLPPGSAKFRGFWVVLCTEIGVSGTVSALSGAFLGVSGAVWEVFRLRRRAVPSAVGAVPARGSDCYTRVTNYLGAGRS